MRKCVGCKRKIAGGLAEGHCDRCGAWNGPAGSHSNPKAHGKCVCDLQTGIFNHRVCNKCGSRGHCEGPGRRGRRSNPGQPEGMRPNPPDAKFTQYGMDGKFRQELSLPVAGYGMGVLRWTAIQATKETTYPVIPGARSVNPPSIPVALGMSPAEHVDQWMQLAEKWRALGPSDRSAAMQAVSVASTGFAGMVEMSEAGASAVTRPGAGQAQAHEGRSLDRNEAIKLIRAALKRRSGKSWSVTGGRGTAWGWIEIDAPPARRVWDHEGTTRKDKFGYMSKADREELGRLLGLGRPSYLQGENIPASSDYRIEYVDRAEGRSPRVIGTPYWD